MRGQKGVSLIELIAVIVIVGVLSVAVTAQLGPSSTYQLQASRDSLVAALTAAQQQATARGGNVRVVTGGGRVDVQREVSPGDYQSMSMGGTQYPLTLLTGQSVSSHTINFNSLGRTDPANITLAQDGNTITIELSASGFSH